MQLFAPVRAPFDLAQSLIFMRRFAPCRADVIIDDDRVTAPFAIAGRAVRCTVGAGDGGLLIDVDEDLAPATAALVVARARQWLSADDDLTGFLRAAEGDAPAFRALTTMLHGLHHVRFLSLAEISVYAVMTQRTPIVQAARAKQRFLARFGHPLVVGGMTLRACPELHELTGLEADDYREVVRQPAKAAALPGVVRGVAAIGEAFLRSAPYADARAALLAIPGIGPFSAAMILLRGLGRMDDVPLDGEQFAGPARAIYGADYDPATIRRRYGADLGYWSYYLKTGVPRLVADGAVAAAPPRRSGRVTRELR